MRPAIAAPLAGPRTGGFSLVEALIALAIIAALSAALFTTMTGQARMRGAMSQRQLALMVGQSVLAQSEGGYPADAGTWQFTTAHPDQWPPMAWHIDRERYDAGGAIGAGSGFGAGTRLERVSVAVESASHRRLALLRSIRIIR